MRLSVRFLIILLPVLALVIVGFNKVMDQLESRWALKDLYNRGELLYQLTQEQIIEAVGKGKLKSLHRVYKQTGRRDAFKNVLGVLVCSKSSKIISRSPGLPSQFKCDWKDFDQQRANEESAMELLATARLQSGIIDIEKSDKNKFDKAHRSIFLLRDEPQMDEEAEASEEPASLVWAQVKGYVLIFQNPAYRIERSETARRYTTYAFLILGFFISIITLVVYRWSVSKPVEQMSEVMKGVLTGDADKIARALEKADFVPHVKDLDQVLGEFARTKTKDASNGKAVNTAARKLSEEFKRRFGESRLCVISNEEPYVHQRRGTKIAMEVPASGVVSSIEPIMKSCNGVWIGPGRGSADHETADNQGMILVPPDNPEYALKRVWLNKEEELGFHYGFAIEGLWPLCHIAHERPHFRHEDWDRYVEVNAKFASTFSDQIKNSRPVAMVQDYHFALVPSMIRKMRPDAIVGLNWHIPWPAPETIRILPWRKDLLLGMLGADVITFPLPYHANNFLDSVHRFLEARVSRDNYSITVQGRTTYVKSIPQGVAWQDSNGFDYESNRSTILQDLALAPKTHIGLGVDRLDYTKGIIERFYAIERFLDQNPDYVGKFSFIQIASPSRLHNKRYQDLHSEIQKVADRINWKYYNEACPAIVLKLDHQSKEDLQKFYRAADFCYVNSLHDGMNLVSKEFVVSRGDDKGVLILSAFTGSIYELKDAINVNPYNIEDCADAIKRAIEMGESEQKSRMERLRKIVSTNSAHEWGSRFFKELHSRTDFGMTEADQPST